MARVLNHIVLWLSLAGVLHRRVLLHASSSCILILASNHWGVVATSKDTALLVGILQTYLDTNSRRHLY